MANRNRTAGHNYERSIVNELKELGFDCVTARSESRNKDDMGIDIFGDEGAELPHDIQCKVSKSFTSKQIRDILSRGRELKPLVVVHKHVAKSPKGRFVGKGEYVYMHKDLYYELLQNL